MKTDNSLIVEDTSSKSVFRKLLDKGVAGTLKAAGRRFQGTVYQPEWDFKLVPELLSQILRQNGSVTLVQIGANVGKTDSDQVYEFLKKNCFNTNAFEPFQCRAVLVEPVRHLFDQLIVNYAGFHGVSCENAAIGDVSGVKNFYRLRAGIDLELHGLPPWSEQLGSFIPQQMESLWAHDPGNKQLREFVNENIVVDEVRCLTIHDLLEKHQLTKVDLLQIDTEGYDYHILKTINFQQLAPSYINYERIHLKEKQSECRAMLLNHGYSLHDHGQDTLCDLSSKKKTLKLWLEYAYCIWLKCIY